MHDLCGMYFINNVISQEFELKRCENDVYSTADQVFLFLFYCCYPYLLSYFLSSLSSSPSLS